MGEDSVVRLFVEPLPLEVILEVFAEPYRSWVAELMEQEDNMSTKLPPEEDCFPPIDGAVPCHHYEELFAAYLRQRDALHRLAEIDDNAPLTAVRTIARTALETTE